MASSSTRWSLHAAKGADVTLVPPVTCTLNVSPFSTISSSTIGTRIVALRSPAAMVTGEAGEPEPWSPASDAVPFSRAQATVMGHLPGALNDTVKVALPAASPTVGATDTEADGAGRCSTIVTARPAGWDRRRGRRWYAGQPHPEGLIGLVGGVVDDGDGRR